MFVIFSRSVVPLDQLGNVIVCLPIFPCSFGTWILTEDVFSRVYTLRVPSRYIHEYHQ